MSSVLAPIYERMSGTSSYKPFSASTFADWSSEAGDTVTISRDGTSYSAPLHKQTIKWNGSQQVTMETTGNEERDSVTKQSTDKMNSTSGGYASSLASYGKFHTFEVNDEHLMYEVFDDNGKLARLTVEASQIRSELEDSVNSLYSSITQEASQIRSEVHNAESSLYSAITQTESQIRMEVGDVANSLHSEITQTASSIRLSISGVTDSSGKVTAASIALAINNAGSSVALINADHVKISGNTTINDIFGVNGSGYLTIAGDVYSTGTFNIGGANIASGGSISFITGTAPLSYATISGTEVNEMIIKASVSGNTLQLWKRGDSPSGNPSITFSKATSLSGSWSGTTYTVTASPQGNTESTNVYLAVEGAANPNETIYAKIYKDNPSVAGNQLTSTEMTLAENVSSKTVTLSANTLTKGSVSTQATYNAGYNAGVPIGVTLGSKVTGTIWNVSIQRSTGSAVGKTIDLSSAYTDARSGYYTKAQYDANYTSGYNASHTIGIYDSSGNAVSSQSITSAISLWAGMKKSDGSFQWGGQVTITPSASHPNSITFTYDGMSSSQSGGQTIYTYKYHLTNTSGYQPASGRTTFYY